MIPDSSQPSGSPFDGGDCPLTTHADPTDPVESDVDRLRAQLAGIERFATLGSYRWDMARDELVWSEGVYRVFGVDPASFQPTLASFRALVHPDDRPRVLAMTQQVLAAPADYALEFRVIGGDGVHRYVQDRGEVRVDDAGRPIAVLGAVQDISYRKEAEEAVQQSVRRAQLYLDIAGVMLISVAADEKVTMLNAKGCQILGYTEEEILGRNWFNVCIPDDQRERIRRLFRELIAGRIEPTERVENDVLTKDGQRKLMAWTNSVVRDETGAITGLLASGEDITARRQAECDLHASEQRLRTIIQYMPVMMDAFDDQQLIAAWNRECERVTGYLAEEVIGNPDALTMMYPDRAYREALLEEWRRRGHDYYNWEVDLICKDGSVRTIAWFSIAKHVPIPGWATWGVGVDVTERKQAEEARAALQQQLYQAQKLEAVGRLAGGVAHDISTLLSAIIGYTQLVRTAMETSTEAGQSSASVIEAGKSLDAIDEAVSQAGSVSRSLLTFSCESPVEQEPLELGALLRRSVSLLQRILPANITCEADLPEAPPVWVVGDVAQLQQVVLNLIVNAQDAMPEGGRLTVALRMAATTHRQRASAEELGSESAVIEVTDTGVGIPSDRLARIFDPFYSTKTKEKGTGLGLAIVHGMVRSHGGLVEVDSQVGRGTRFQVLLPLCPVEQAVQPGGVPRSGYDEAVGQGELVLLMEGNAHVRRIMATVLRARGYEVIAAADRAGLATRWAEHGPRVRLLVIDLESDRDGVLAWLQALRQERHHVPLLLLTAAADEDESLSAELDTLMLCKPFEMRDLEELATAILARSHREE